jgi:hypothetical protein
VIREDFAPDVDTENPGYVDCPRNANDQYTLVVSLVSYSVSCGGILSEARDVVAGPMASVSEGEG